jgi:hypothetical protein
MYCWLIRFLQLAQLEKEVKERSKKDVQKEQAEAEAPIINPGLMITNGPTGYVWPRSSNGPSTDSCAVSLAKHLLI